MPRALAVSTLCFLLMASGCDRETPKSPEELLAEDTSLAMDLARADDALAGAPDTSIGLTDDDAPMTSAPNEPEPHIEFATPDPGVPRAPAAARPNVSAQNARPAQPEIAAQEPRTVVDASAPGCSSPGREDQRSCLLSLLARYDAELNKTYRDVIRRMRADAGAGPGDPDPASVRDLRDTQRSWLVYRDRECRRRTRSREGELWAPVRARCLGELSDARARELRSM